MNIFLTLVDLSIIIVLVVASILSYITMKSFNKTMRQFDEIMKDINTIMTNDNHNE